MPLIVRTPWVDDDGTGMTGTVLNNAALQALYGEIDTANYSTVVYRTDTGAFNNWDPGLNGDHTLVAWSGSALLELTGFANAVEGKRVTLWNNGTASINVYHLHGGSGLNACQNIAPILTPIAPGGHATYSYVTTGGAWRLVAHEQGAWVPYTPAWGNTGTANTLGASVLTGASRVSGRTCQFRIRHAWGAGTVGGSGAFTYTFPYPVVAAALNGSAWGTVLLDASAGAFVAEAQGYNATSMVIYAPGAPGASMPRRRFCGRPAIPCRSSARWRSDGPSKYSKKIPTIAAERLDTSKPTDQWPAGARWRRQPGLTFHMPDPLAPAPIQNGD